jgi:hypothetical protein
VGHYYSAVYTSAKNLLLYFVLLIFFIIAALFLGTYIKISALPIVTDPVEFTKQYDYEGKPFTEYLGVNIALKGRELLSPYFPYRLLDGTYMSDGKCRHIINNNDGVLVVLREERWLNIDPFWNVFWVEIEKCGEHIGPNMFFGPYRIRAI